MQKLLISVFLVSIWTGVALAESPLLNIVQCRFEEKSKSLDYRISVKQSCLKNVNNLSQFVELMTPTIEPCEPNSANTQCLKYFHNLELLVIDHYWRYLNSHSSITDISELSCFVEEPLGRTSILLDGMIAVRDMSQFERLLRTNFNSPYCNSDISNKNFREVSRKMGKLYVELKPSMMVLSRDNVLPDTIGSSIVFMSRKLSDFRKDYPFLSESFRELIQICNSYIRLNTNKMSVKDIEIKKYNLVSQVLAYDSFLKEINDHWSSSFPISLYIGHAYKAMQVIKDKSNNWASNRVLAQLKMAKSHISTLKLFLPQHWDLRVNKIQYNIKTAIRYTEASSDNDIVLKYIEKALRSLKEKNKSADNISFIHLLENLDGRFSVTNAREKELSIITNSLLSNLLKLETLLGENK
ncbi:MAG: hypothetical protein HOO06_07845 [Bdellovibrionaceae bacterium]|nr:hypothetical protein [Pseudobdellovibrionaceae bacterium]